MKSLVWLDGEPGPILSLFTFIAVLAPFIVILVVCR